MHSYNWKKKHQTIELTYSTLSNYNMTTSGTDANTKQSTDSGTDTSTVNGSNTGTSTDVNTRILLQLIQLHVIILTVQVWLIMIKTLQQKQEQLQM